MHEGSKNMAKMAEQMRHSVGAAKEDFVEFSKQSDVALSSVNKAGNTCFRSLIKVDHMIYKQKAYKLFSSGLDIPEAADVQVDSHSCRLGKWYFDGIGKRHFSEKPSYLSLQNPQDKVHAAAHQLMEELRGDWLCNEHAKGNILSLY